MKKEVFPGFPSKVLKNRNLSCLESIVYFYKTKKNLSYREIAKVLNRDDRTIWTVYNRAMKKLGRIK